MGKEVEGKYKDKETDKYKKYVEEEQGFHVNRLTVEKVKCRDQAGKVGYREIYRRVWMLCDENLTVL